MFVVIRADASKHIGSGHIMRCLTLAKELRNLGAIVEFITRNHSENLNTQIIEQGFKLRLLPNHNKLVEQRTLSEYEQWLGVSQSVDAEETIKALSGKQPDLLIVDHYALDYNWEKKLRKIIDKIMVIDDLANRRHDCDFLLDQNYTHDYTRYDRLLSPGTIKLLGPKYALLGKNFIQNAKNRIRDYHTIKRVFVFFGGADLDNLTSVVLQVFSQPKLKHLYVDLVIGFANPYKDKLKIEVDKYPNVNLYIQVDDIAELMVKADIALGAGGTTTWERMALGLPSIVVTTADNQVACIKNLDQGGYLKWLGDVNYVDKHTIYNALLEAGKNPNKLKEQSQNCQTIVNGKGAQIVSRLLISGPEAKTLSVRKANDSDSLLYWYWANDPVVRRNAFNQQTIEWERHQEWFEYYSKNPGTILLLIESEFSPIGQVRFDWSSSKYIISYSLAKQYRGYGLGEVMLKRAIDYLQQEVPSFTLVGKIKAANTASIKVFKRLDFSEFFPSYRKIGVKYFQLKSHQLNT